MKVIIVIAVALSLPGVLPANITELIKSLNFPKCAKDNKELGQCLIRGINSLKPILKNGVPDLSIPRLEPFTIKSLELNAEGIGFITIKGEATNIVARGASDLQIQNMNVNLDNNYMKLKVMIPSLDITADYNLQGSRFTGLGIDDRGQFHGVINEITATVTAQGHRIERNGLPHLKLDDLSADINFLKSVIKIQPKSTSLSAQTAASWINSHSDKFLRMLKTSIDNKAASLIHRYANKILKSVPLSDIIVL